MSDHKRLSNKMSWFCKNSYHLKLCIISNKWHLNATMKNAIIWVFADVRLIRITCFLNVMFLAFLKMFAQNLPIGYNFTYANNQNIFIINIMYRNATYFVKC